MAAPHRILALDLGMQSVTLADFRPSADGGIALYDCKQEELIVDPAADATRGAQIEAAVARLKKELGVTGRDKVTFCLPSQSVFTRFVKLPGSTPEDVESIIGFEAQQNVPFPIDEVVWDHQILGESKDHAWNVALVAMKADQLTEINTSINKAGLRSHIIDVAPMALYNAFRYNYSTLDDCSLLIDIGARTTNLVFIEGQRVFSRSIPVGGSTISAAIAKEFKQDITFGEKLKKEKGFVSLGGAYAEPEDPTEMRISKIIRNTLTRLHADIARSISFYRQNQGGSAPARAYLCGGTVSLPYMVEFFSEKLQTPIEYFNPLKNVTIANPGIGEFVASRSHTLGELVGCALRNLDNCPVEINLRPPSVVREQDLAKRKPFLVLAAVCILLSLGGWWYYFVKAEALTQEQLQGVNAEVSKLDALASQFTALEGENRNLQEMAAPLLLAAAERSAWSEILDELATRIPAHFIWVTELQPMSNGQALTVSGTPVPGPGRGGVKEPQAEQASNTPPQRGPGSGPERQQAKGPAIDAIQLSGLYLAKPPNDKEQGMIDEFVDQLRQSPVFAMKEKSNREIVIQRTTPDGRSWAYAYTIILPLKNPISLP